PTNYVGPTALFGEEPRFDLLRTIEDGYGIFPLRHKADLRVDALPESLVDGVLSFLLANAIRDLRGQGPTHRSMLVNVSRFTAVQDQVASLVHEQLSTIQQDIRNYSQLSPQQALRNSSLARAERVWSDEYADAGFTWAIVQRSLLN